MAEAETYELFAVKYGSHDRNASMNFIDPPDPHDGPMPIDYFLWAAVSDERTVVIDTGFGEVVAKARGRTVVRCPTEGLSLIGIDAATVEDVVITHMHYDHLGSFHKFPAATFHLQDREMAFATGRHMRYRNQRASFDVDMVTGLVREVYAERVRFHDGDAELAPGLGLHRVGGHTDGLQVVRAWTRRGWVVLASDASHLYANMETGNPYPIIFHTGDMLEGHETLRRLADSPEHIIPGHDPLVMARYPAPSAELEGIVVRLDVAPRG